MLLQMDFAVWNSANRSKIVQLQMNFAIGTSAINQYLIDFFFDLDLEIQKINKYHQKCSKLNIPKTLFVIYVHFISDFYCSTLCQMDNFVTTNTQLILSLGFLQFMC